TIDASHLFPDKLVLEECGKQERAGKSNFLVHCYEDPIEEVQVDRDELLNVDDRNWKSVVCRRCDSLIFPEDRVKLVDDYKARLPLMSPGGKGCTETEEVSLWWYTQSDMDFDTVGFAWVVIDNKKTLLCGDCEFGPIGLRTLDDKQYWVAAERVAHVDKPPPPGAKPRPKKDKKKKHQVCRFQVNRANLLNVDNKNWQSIVCRRCDSLILFEDKVDLLEGIIIPV
ncbi:Mss4 protein, partial [Ostertagia ostertagi]